MLQALKASLRSRPWGISRAACQALDWRIKSSALRASPNTALKSRRAASKRANKTRSASGRTTSGSSRTKDELEDLAIRLNVLLLLEVLFDDGQWCSTDSTVYRRLKITSIRTAHATAKARGLRGHFGQRARSGRGSGDAPPLRTAH